MGKARAGGEQENVYLGQTNVKIFFHKFAGVAGPTSHRPTYGDSIVRSRSRVAIMSSVAPPTIPASLQIYKYVQNLSHYPGRSLFMPLRSC